jgi:hypothetical protein
MSLCKLFITIVFLMLSVHYVTLADDPRTIFHQGLLTDEAGIPVEDRAYIFTFRIYNDASEGPALWNETQAVVVSGGVFHTWLGKENPINLSFDEQYWVGISIDGGDELVPRMPLGAAPYAIHALSVKDGAVTTEKLASEAVTPEKLHPDISLPVTYEFTVSASDWGNNLHYGSSNIFRAYTISPENVGGINVISFFNNGGAILVYANAHHTDGGSLGGWHNLPYMYQSVDGIGVKILYLISRGQLAIARTTSGWDSNSISDENLPDSVEFKIVFIKNIN